MLWLAVGSIILGLLLILRGISRIRVRRRLFGSLYWSSGLGMASIGLLFMAAAMNLYTYHRLTSEILVASVKIKQIAPNNYELALSEAGKQPANFKIMGDEWQLDARFLRWKSWATILGQEPMFRLERLSGRYGDIEQAKAARPSLYALSSQSGVDVWKLGRQYAEWLPFMDAYFGSSVYMPLIADGEYRVTATDSGLMVRAVNAPAKEVLKEW
jgi:hypothetical protein